MLHSYSQEEPFWRVEIDGNGGAIKWAGYWGGIALDKFVEVNSKALDAARRAVSTP